MKRRLLLLIFLVIGLLGATIASFWVLLAILFDPSGERPMNIILAMDRLFNSSIGGCGKETLSSRAGRLVEEKDCKWACALCKFLDWLQKDHCKTSIGT